MIKIFEENVKRLLQDKTFLQVSSLHFNSMLWWQKKMKELSGQTDQMEKLYEEVHRLEKRNHLYEEKLELLETELKLLKEKSEAKKRRSPRKARTTGIEA